jgi:hypothetical protein
MDPDRPMLLKFLYDTQPTKTISSGMLLAITTFAEHLHGKKVVTKTVHSFPVI